MNAARRLKVLLPTVGSAGDVHPFIGLGLELKRRGHRAVILTNPMFAPLIERMGLGFLPIGTEAAARAAIAHPELWHLRKGFRVIAQALVPAIEETYRLIESQADGDTVVAFSTLALGARLAQEKLGIKSASVHLQPSVIRTYGDQGMLGDLRMSAAHPKWFKGLMFRLIDALVLDRALQGPLNELRGRLGLAPVERVMHRWLHSPELVLAFFPEWFAAPQPDWPPNTHLVGFPLWDLEPAPQLEAAFEFLAAGPAPLVFTPGSAGATMHRYFEESVAAVRELGLRAMLVTNFPEQVPRNLPAGVQLFEYLPFSQILPKAALLAYHGGIGTLAQAVRAGVPQLVVPHGYDQFDSGWRMQQLGLGQSIPHHSYRRGRVLRAIRQLLDDAGLPARCQRFAACADAGGIGRAADLIERLAG